MKIYVASSWRNQEQQSIVQQLRGAGHEVYDFKNPNPGDRGFHWSEIDPNWKNWTMRIYRECLNNPIAEMGYLSDYNAMRWADVFVGVMPFGRSASMEMGWASGNGKKTILLLSDAEPELMVKMFDKICVNMEEVLNSLG